MYDCYDDTIGGRDMPSPYPIYPKDRGQEFQNVFTRGNEEFNPQQYERNGLSHDAPWAMPTQATELQYASSQPSVHRIEGQTLDPGRTIRNPSRYVAPCLISSIYQDGAYGRPSDIEDSCPDPMIQRSFGQWTAAVDDVRHTIPKQGPDYDYAAVNQQDIADRARIALRKAMYGR